MEDEKLLAEEARPVDSVNRLGQPDRSVESDRVKVKDIGFFCQAYDHVSRGVALGKVSRFHRHVIGMENARDELVVMRRMSLERGDIPGRDARAPIAQM